MEFQRKKILSAYPWLQEEGLPFITSADYDGLICASFLHQHFGWKLTGYYNLTSLWLSEEATQNSNDLIWVDLNILSTQGRAIGGHIVSLNGELPRGFKSSCNPNIMANLNADKFKEKFPFSTLIFLLWLHDVQIEKELLARMLVLHSDASWLKYQEYGENVNKWFSGLENYDWKWLFQKVNSITFEKRVDEILYPELKKIGAVSGLSKLSSKKLNIKSRQFQFNPDWDEDVILNLFRLFGNKLNWTPPSLPKISHRIDGTREKIALSKVREMGLSKFLKENNIFSYAIPSPRILNYTSFGSIKSPIDASS
ncbi:MAG: hypothetical protein H8E72_04620 [Candidatus Marinimicrobia bacterium]|nr:hypothetical protein [Candidatus Neomarinimicrobiota bacterium]